jgi:hypothetical protein
MSVDPSDPTGERARHGVQKAYDDGKAGRFVQPNSHEEAAAMWDGRRAKAWQDYVNQTFDRTIAQGQSGGDFPPRLVLFVVVSAMAAGVLGWLVYLPKIENFFNRHFTDPGVATMSGKFYLKSKNYAQAAYGFEIGASRETPRGDSI